MASAQNRRDFGLDMLFYSCTCRGYAFAETSSDGILTEHFESHSVVLSFISSGKTPHFVNRDLHLFYMICGFKNAFSQPCIYTDSTRYFSGRQHSSKSVHISRSLRANENSAS